MFTSRLCRGRLTGCPVAAGGAAISPKVDRPTVADARSGWVITTERDGELCQRCLRDCGPLAREHLQNRMPGNTVASNLNCLGLACHIWKTEHRGPRSRTGGRYPGGRTCSSAPRRWFRTEIGTRRAG